MKSKSVSVPICLGVELAFAFVVSSGNNSDELVVKQSGSDRFGEILSVDVK